MVARLRSFVETPNDFQARLRESNGVKLAQPFDSEIVAMPEWETVTQRAGEFLDSAIGWFERYGRDALMYQWAWGGKTFGHTW